PETCIRYGQQTVEKLFTVTNYVRYIGLGLIALLVFIALVFINNTIRLAIMARQREISIMRLVGASNGFIRGPFLTESILHALIGAGLAIGSLEAVRVYALPKLSQDLQWLPLNLPMQNYYMVFGVLAVAGILIAVIGSAFSMRRYLKV
ncbi:MAG: FtsX-like permease family protein, partial [Eggerthellaceae bacterium]|nr:FtsX-like permease family protein [Eggerthellaceae bacterium]